MSLKPAENKSFYLRLDLGLQSKDLDGMILHVKDTCILASRYCFYCFMTSLIQLVANEQKTSEAGRKHVH